MAFLEKVRQNFLNQPWGKSRNYFIVDSTKDSEITQKSIRDIVMKYLETTN